MRQGYLPGQYYTTRLALAESVDGVYRAITKKMEDRRRYFIPPETVFDIAGEVAIGPLPVAPLFNKLLTMDAGERRRISPEVGHRLLAMYIVMDLAVWFDENV